jgi:hypothetical protein
LKYKNYIAPVRGVSTKENSVKEDFDNIYNLNHIGKEYMFTLIETKNVYDVNSFISDKKW